MRRFVMRAAVALGVACSSLSIARGDTPPSSWDVARDSSLTKSWALHAQAQQLLVPMGLRIPRALVHARFERARELLIEGGAPTSSDVRLRFDLGEVDERLELHDEAVKVLTAALAIAPHHPAADAAWLSLAYAHAKLDQPREERAAYEGYLALAVDDGDRAVATLNLAEAYMREGRMEDAVAGYTEAARLALESGGGGGGQTGILAEWGLAVALDRAGDPVGAADAARKAGGMDPRRFGLGGGRRAVIEDRSGVFFVPSYERLWYLALAESEDALAAQRSGDAWHAALFFRRTEQMWTIYLDRAARARTPDRWIPLAKAHLAHAHAARLAAERRAVRISPPVEDEELPPVDTEF